MSNSQNIKEIINKSAAQEMIVKSFAKKFGLDENIVRESLDQLIDKKLNEVGANFNKNKQNGFGKFENISSDDFLNKDIKIIKEE